MRSPLSRLVVPVFACALLAFGANAHAQDAPDQDEPPEKTDAEKQAEAGELFKEGTELAKEKKYKEALEKFEAAYEAYPDPDLQVVIGEAYQLLGNETGDYENYKKAIEAYKKYLANAPEGTTDEQKAQRTKLAEGIAGRVKQLQTSIDDEVRRKDKEAEEERQAKLQEEKEKKEAEDKKRREAEAKRAFRPAIDAMVIAGIDADTTALARFLAGGIFGWRNFGFEAHLGFEGFLRINGDKGVSARSLTLIDVGLRYGFGQDNYRGFFVSGGGGFGLFGGKPREVKLEGDTETCPGFDNETPGTCVFDVDKNISGRIGLGYGFAASEKTTVAVRLDMHYFQFSVDGEQSAGAVPAPRVARPQNTFSVLIGLEFMRWGS